ncbi:MAG: helix-turn-helix domain-containing protein [Eubacteriales bacterium]
MKNINLYEQIPKNDFPLTLRIDEYRQFKFRLHWHEHVEIHCIFEGNGIIRLGEEIIELKAGDCAVANGNELHSGIGGECSRGCLIIPPEFFGNNHVIFEHLIQDDNIFSMCSNILECFKDFNNVSSLEIIGHTYLMVCSLIKNYSRINLSEAHHRQYFEKLEKINKAIQFIEENFTNDITTQSLAEMVYVSEGYFCNLFKEVTGKSAKEYIIQLRVKKAMSLLSSSSFSITDVCYMCGFSDPNYFTRVFKKKTGSLPSEFRLKKEVEA